MAWVQISFGAHQSKGIKDDGSLWAWGDPNLLGVYDHWNYINTTPSRIGTGNSWIFVGASGWNVHGVESNLDMWGWGGNYYGSLGINYRWSVDEPVKLLGKWTKANSTHYHTLLIDDSDHLWSVGYNYYGQLGVGYAGSWYRARSAPSQLGTDTWLQVATGEMHSLALRSDGTLWGWGENWVGQLGLLDLSQYKKFSSFTAGHYNIFAKDTSNILWGWGSNYYGQFGDDTMYVGYSSPVLVNVDWKHISSTQTYTLIIADDNTLWGCGFNDYGQLGDGTYDAQLSPIQISSNSWKQVCGTISKASYGIRSNGTLWAWGSNTYGQLGVGDTDDRNSPVQIGSDTNWQSVNSTNDHVLALKTNGTLWGWGTNDFGQLGELPASGSQLYAIKLSLSLYDHTMLINENNNLFAVGGSNWNGELGLGYEGSLSSPVQVGTESWSVVSGGGYHTLGIRSDGTLWAWGGGWYGQLGNGYGLSQVNSPIQIGSDNDWVSISAGALSSYGIKSDGSLWAWGDNGYGQLGTGNWNQEWEPVQIGSSSWTMVSSGSEFTLAIRADGTLWGWGDNYDGTLGNGSSEDAYESPIQVGNYEDDWIRVWAGRNTSFALKSNNTLWGWGPNWSGQIGNGETDDIQYEPVMITGNWLEAKNYQGRSFGIKSDGSLWAWGDNYEYRLLLPIESLYTVPTRVGTTTNWKSIYVTSEHVIGKRGDVAYGFGSNYDGTLGLNKTTPISQLTMIGGPAPPKYLSSPVQLGTGSWAQVAAGDKFSVIRSSNGTIWGSGQNDYFQLGLDVLSPAETSFTQIGTSSWASIDAGGSFAGAISAAGEFYIWGSNEFNQTGHWMNVSSPLLVAANVIKFELGYGTTYFLSDDTIYGIGRGYEGQLDNESSGIFDRIVPLAGPQISGAKSSPVQIGTESNWTFVAAHGYHSFGIKTDGSLWAWGENNYDQLGLPNSLYFTPTKVNNFSWNQVAAGLSHTLGLTSTGILYSWGSNSKGQLGLGDQTPRSVPTQVDTRIWTQITAGHEHSGAIAAGGNLWTWGSNDYGEVGEAQVLSLYTTPQNLDGVVAPELGVRTLNRNSSNQYEQDLFTRLDDIYERFEYWYFEYIRKFYIDYCLMYDMVNEEKHSGLKPLAEKLEEAVDNHIRFLDDLAIYWHYLMYQRLYEIAKINSVAQTLLGLTSDLKYFFNVTSKDGETYEDGPEEPWMSPHEHNNWTYLYKVTNEILTAAENEKLDLHGVEKQTYPMERGINEIIRYPTFLHFVALVRKQNWGYDELMCHLAENDPNPLNATDIGVDDDAYGPFDYNLHQVVIEYIEAHSIKETEFSLSEHIKLVEHHLGMI